MRQILDWRAAKASSRVSTAGWEAILEGALALGASRPAGSCQPTSTVRALPPAAPSGRPPGPATLGRSEKAPHAGASAFRVLRQDPLGTKRSRDVAVYVLDYRRLRGSLCLARNGEDRPFRLVP